MSQAAASVPADSFVRIENVVKLFGETTAVDHVSLSIGRGEVFALLGSSGCGKSTLLRMLAGLESVSSGSIRLDGEEISSLPPYRRPVNMMFQSYALFPHMTVAANVAYGLKQERTPKAEIKQRVAAALELVQMGRFASRRPHQLSGGQQQRVALARSLVKRPKVLLLDEPMSALDKQIRQQTQIELLNILRQVGVTCIMVTHDQEEAMTMASRLAVMSEGRIVQVGAPRDVYEFPNSRFSAGFIGTTNLFTGTLLEVSSDLSGQGPGQARLASEELERPISVGHVSTGLPGAPLSVSVRPEHMRISFEPPSDANNWSEGSVVNVAYLGAHSMFHVRLKSGKVVLAQLSSQAVADLLSAEAARSGCQPATLAATPPGTTALPAQVYISWAPGAGVLLSQ